MTAVAVFCALCALLFLGKVIRLHVPFLQRLYLPSSVVGGLVGLVAVTVLSSVLPSDRARAFDAEYVAAARAVPGGLPNAKP